MVNPATVSDLEVRWRPMSDAERDVEQAVLDDAWEAVLLPLRPTLPDLVAAGSLPERTVRFVLCSMVLRVLRNPDGKSEESIDDYRYRRDAAVSSGALYASPDELGMLTPVVNRARARSVRLVAYGDL
jgi:hypothetical protein